MKQLIIARHAKSDRSNGLCFDFDRGLNMRGKQDLKKMSKLLERNIKKPDVIVASPSKRTQKNALAYASVRGYKEKNIVREQDLYEASLRDLLTILESFDESLDTVMIVGHNPGLTELVNHCGYDLENLPTCGIVVFDYDGEYRGNFEEKKCCFKEFLYPKM